MMIMTVGGDCGAGMAGVCIDIVAAPLDVAHLLSCGCVKLAKAYCTT